MHVHELLISLAACIEFDDGRVGILGARLSRSSVPPLERAANDRPFRAFEARMNTLHASRFRSGHVRAMIVFVIISIELIVTGNC